MSLALAGGFLTTAPPGKPQSGFKPSVMLYLAEAGLEFKDACDIPVSFPGSNVNSAHFISCSQGSGYFWVGGVGVTDGLFG